MSEPARSRDLPGYRVEAVEAWIAENVPDLAPPFEWTQLVGGHSNLTYTLKDRNGKKAVIRRPPEGELLPKAHDMSREWALISGLAPTPVPVPYPHGFCESPDITGAWFYVMGWVDGRSMHSRQDVETHIPETMRETAAFSFIDTLAALHCLDPDEIGLGTLGRKEGYIARQVKAWYGSWTSAMETAQHDDPRAHDIKDYLLTHTPEQGPARVVHGDYGPHNVLFGSDAQIGAVIDWEVATLGDPMADLGYALNWFQDDRDALPIDPNAFGAASGFPSRDALAERYAKKTGADLSQLDFYFAFNNWKGAAIIHGVRARYIAGNKSAEGVDLDAMKARTVRGLTLAEQAINRIG